MEWRMQIRRKRGVPIQILGPLRRPSPHELGLLGRSIMSVGGIARFVPLLLCLAQPLNLEPDIVMHPLNAVHYVCMADILWDESRLSWCG